MFNIHNCHRSDNCIESRINSGEIPLGHALGPGGLPLFGIKRGLMPLAYERIRVSVSLINETIFAFQLDQRKTEIIIRH